jgi:hypothetical protein
MTISEDNHIQVINSYKLQDWQPLFSLIPRIEDAATYSSHVNKEAIIQEFLKIVYEIPIMVRFDWGSWDEGRNMVTGKTLDFDSIDIPTKCKLLTAIVRNDRFCEGALFDAFESGLILKILKSIQEQVMRV